MIKKVYFAALLLGSLAVSAMEQYDDSKIAACDSELIVCRMDPNSSESEDPEINECDLLSEDEAYDFIALLNDSVTSLTPYVFYSGKMLVNGTSALINFAIQNPKAAIYMGLCIAIPAVAAANCTACNACDCGCTYKGTIGRAPDIMTCVNLCKQLGVAFTSCHAPK